MKPTKKKCCANCAWFNFVKGTDIFYGHNECDNKETKLGYLPSDIILINTLYCDKHKFQGGEK